MQHFGLSPPGPIAALVIILELGASVMILSGIYRWVGAIALGSLSIYRPLLPKKRVALFFRL
jgi:uncharacterized membrane protein YphA (DoxX/SURF4 family)